MAKASSSSKTQYNPHRPNFWGMMRDVMLASINKGQFLIAMVGFIVMVSVMRMPANDIGQLWKDTISLFKTTATLGWVISGFSLPIVFVLFKIKSRLHRKEVERIMRISTKGEIPKN